MRRWGRKEGGSELEVAAHEFCGGEVIGKMDDVAKRTKADIYLSMSKVANENDDSQGCVHHMEAVREVLGF